MTLPAAPVKAFVTSPGTFHRRARDHVRRSDRTRRSEVFGDLSKLFDRARHVARLVLDRMGQAVLDMIVDQGPFGCGDGPLDGVELLSHIQARAAGFHHADDVSQMTFGALQALDDVRVGPMDDMSHDD